MNVLRVLAQVFVVVNDSHADQAQMGVAQMLHQKRRI